MSGSAKTSLSADVLAILRCASCNSPLVEYEDGCRCESCGKTFHALNGVLSFVDTSNYADSFGYQWKKFDKTQLLPDYAEWNLRKKTNLGPEDFKGRLVLDVGCGMGRFADVATRWGARVVGVDLSSAAEVAAHNLSDRAFTALQADVLSLPFAPESFDCIYSIGVLHHTPDCEKAFKNLPRYLKPGGSLGVWLYSGYNKWYRFSDYYRKLTHRMSPRSLHRFFSVMVPVLFWTDCGLRRIPLIGSPLAGLIHHVFPISLNLNPQVRLLDTLDWYSPKYQSKHTYEQVFRWFEDCGFESLTVADISIGVKGRKPLAAARQKLQGVQAEKIPAESVKFGPPAAPGKLVKPRGMAARTKIARTMRWLPSYAWQALTRPAPSGKVHLMIMLADHFEPAVVPEQGSARVPSYEQERRVEAWTREYPRVFDRWRDNEGYPFVHTYFYPAEQYDRGLLKQLAHHCRDGWGEIETHLHHGGSAPDTEANTRRQLLEFRDALAFEHESLCYLDGEGGPRYAFVHGDYALANSAGGLNCGVDSEMQILADTGCYADFTLPPGPYYRTHVAKINSLYECSLPLNQRAPHRKGGDLECGRRPTSFPLMVEGPLRLVSGRHKGRRFSIENGALTAKTPPTLQRLQYWKRAAISVKGRSDWIFIKLQCHGMDPRDREVMLGEAIHEFLRNVVQGASQRTETIHFVSARQMVNIILAACDGREGNPGDYRDYRLKRYRTMKAEPIALESARLVLEG